MLEVKKLFRRKKVLKKEWNLSREKKGKEVPSTLKREEKKEDLSRKVLKLDDYLSILFPKKG